MISIGSLVDCGFRKEERLRVLLFFNRVCREYVYTFCKLNLTYHRLCDDDKNFYRGNVPEKLIKVSPIFRVSLTTTHSSITWVRVVNNAFPKTVSIAFGGVFYWVYFCGVRVQVSIGGREQNSPKLSYSITCS